MPSKPPRPCKQPGCPALVDDAGYCAQHQQNNASRHYSQQRGSSSERGYDARWQRFRRAYLNRPENVMCKEPGCNQVAEHIHHLLKLRDYPHLQYDETNLLGLCMPHHNARTARGE